MRPGDLRRVMEDWVMDHSGHEARAYLGMSQIGRCPAGLYDDMLGRTRPPGPALSALLRQGHLHQADLEMILTDLGLFRPGRELVATWDERLRGHTDGELADGDGEVELVEFKSVNAERFARVRAQNRCFERHYDQVQMYLLHGGYGRGMVIYRCRESGRIWPVPVRLDEARAAELEAKAEAILAAVDEGRRPRCVCGRCGGEG